MQGGGIQLRAEEFIESLYYRGDSHSLGITPPSPPAWTKCQPQESCCVDFNTLGTLGLGVNFHRFLDRLVPHSTVLTQKKDPIRTTDDVTTIPSLTISDTKQLSIPATAALVAFVALALLAEDAILLDVDPGVVIARQNGPCVSLGFVYSVDEVHALDLSILYNRAGLIMLPYLHTKILKQERTVVRNLYHCI